MNRTQKYILFTVVIIVLIGIVVISQLPNDGCMEG